MPLVRLANSKVTDDEPSALSGEVELRCKKVGDDHCLP